MNNSGYILRFVDVVLILLFGFISIATIRESDIELPESTETQREVIDQEEVIFIGVQRDGTFLVDEETRALADVSALERFLRGEMARYEGYPLKVRIRASWDAPVVYLLSAAQLCDDLGLNKAIDVKMRVGDT